ncbi:hypothetical protein MMC27_001314 [Xylographa pallens]|nr:hypothetical protein [Xylographa pallens]
MPPRYHESGSVVSTNTDGGFQQQGSIDWVRLAGSTVNFSIDSLARMSRAGIETLTVCAAEAVFARLRLGPAGEARVHEAVSKLRAFSSFSNALWFGFGVKHVLRKLAESSEGLNCIVMCAALSEEYSSVDSAKILRETFIHCNGLAELTPSLRQWINLVEACEGALATTDFGVVIHNLTRLCLPDGVSNLRICSDHKAIAKALEGIVLVSNRSLESIQLLGGADCGWIAAVSHWLLELSVEIRNSSDEVLFQSSSAETRNKGDPQVVVIYDDPSRVGLLIAKKSFLIPNGQILLRDDLEEQRMRGDVLSYGRVPWASVLTDTFGKRIQILINGGMATNCGTALGAAARIFTSMITDDSAIPDFSYKAYRGSWVYINSSSHGRGFINIIRQKLPEIAESPPVMDAMEEASSASTYLEAIGVYEQAMNLITAACDCNGCKVQVQEEDIEPDQNQPFCQPVLVEVITELVQILSNISMAVPVLPTRAGLEMLYWERYTNQRRRKNWNHVHLGLLNGRQRKPLTSAKDIFSGRTRTTMFAPHAAIASGGLCFYMNTLVDISANSEQCYLVHITSGRIEWNNSIYERITDMRREYTSDLCHNAYEAVSGSIIPSSSCSTLKDSSSPDLICSLLIEEDGISFYKNIQAAYRISTANGRFRIGPCAIAGDMAVALSSKDCKGYECAEMPHFDVSLVHGEGLMMNRGGNSVISTNPIIRVLPKHAAAQWVAVFQDNLYAVQDQNSFQLGKGVVNFLQGRRCLYCLLMQALRGSRCKSDRRSVCIVTSCSES